MGDVILSNCQNYYLFDIFLLYQDIFVNLQQPMNFLIKLSDNFDDIYLGNHLSLIHI